MGYPRGMVDMKHLAPRWFLSLSIQWKLQLGFFVVTMITIMVNRWEGTANSVN